MKTLVFLTFGAILTLFSALKSIQAQQHHDVRRHRSNFNYNTTTTTQSPSITIGYDEMLHRIYNQMSLNSNNDQTHRQKLENLENILERFAQRNRDQLDSIHNEIKELGRRVQNLEWIMARNDGNLNQLRSDLDELRHSGIPNRESNVGKREEQIFMMKSPSSTSIDETGSSEKLEALATLLVSTRAAIRKLEAQTNLIVNNVTDTLHTVREISQHQHGLPTRRYLHNALNNLRSQPYYGLVSNPVGQFNPMNGPLLPTSCAHATIASTGIHKIQVGSTRESFYVMCNNDIEGGGWTVIQNREDGSINFNRNWLEYKNGFGNLAGEFFIGLDKLYDMTSAMLHELLIVMEDFEGSKRMALYKQFAIAGEREDYALCVLGGYEGDAGDSLSYSASYKFSTFDNDNDGWVEGNCALSHTGAWWYNACEMSNLNGQYFSGEVSNSHQFQGIYWNDFRGPKYSLKSVKMMIRPIERVFLPDLN